MLPATQRNRDQPHAWAFEPGHSPPSSMLAQSAGFGRTEVFRTGTTIYSQEDPAGYVYQVSTGIVRTAKLASDGRRVVRGFHVPGEIFGMEWSSAYTCSAEAVCDSYLVRLSQARLETVAAYDKVVGRELLSWLLFNRDHMAQRLLLLGRGSAIEKLAYFLLDLAERLSARHRLEVPMSRSDIGDYLGLSSETVSRTFTTLREKNLISLDGRFVMLLDVKALRVLAGLTCRTPGDTVGRSERPSRTELAARQTFERPDLRRGDSAPKHVTVEACGPTTLLTGGGGGHEE